MAMINIQGVPDELYRQFKSLCALQGKTLKEAIIEMMEEKLVGERPVNVTITEVE